MEQNNSKLKLTIGIPALNEEENIQELLLNLISQDQSNYKLEEIIVVSDGSTDNTVKKVLDLNNPLIKVEDKKERSGKLKSINHIIDMAQGDVIALIDADVIPTSRSVFDKLLEPFIKNANVVYVSGDITPVKPQTFLEQSIIVSRSVWDKLRKILKNGTSVYTCHGALYALKTEFAKANPYPDTVWADIGFHYFVCIKNNLKYVPAFNATVFVKQASTVKDYINQISRYQREDKAMFDYFGNEIEAEYYIPKELLSKLKLEVFLKYPFQCLFIYALNFYAKNLSANARQNASATWTMVGSTKKVIGNGK